MAEKISASLSARVDRALASERAARPRRAKAPDLPAPPPEAPVHELYHEDSVATLLGISRARLRQVRKHLRPGTHWTFDAATRRLAYTQEGLELLRTLLPARPAKQEPSDADLERARTGAVRTAKMRVCRCYPNPRLMLCAELSAPEHGLLVRVRDNAHFIQGMVIDCTADALGNWQFTGRLPRRRGKF